MRARSAWLATWAVAAALRAAPLLLAAPSWAAVQMAQAAPDFALASVNGPNVRLKEQRGKVVLMNFWASWCGPCQQEMPHLSRLYGKYRAAGFELLAVNIDEDAGTAAALTRRWALGFPVLLDTDKTVSRLYDLGTMPTTLLIDRDGVVRYLHRGYKSGLEDTYEAQIRELLRQ